jgi:hypothetical protein
MCDLPEERREREGKLEEPAALSYELRRLICAAVRKGTIAINFVVFKNGWSV